MMSHGGGCRDGKCAWHASNMYPRISMGAKMRMV
uniref:Uncharacterized protein n=1 Tax=Arundo donax TaxID=35708 RepID=A0A0A9BIP0_ARUDO